MKTKREVWVVEGRHRNMEPDWCMFNTFYTRAGAVEDVRTRRMFKRKGWLSGWRFRAIRYAPAR